MKFTTSTRTVKSTDLNIGKEGSFALSLGKSSIASRSTEQEASSSFAFAGSSSSTSAAGIPETSASTQFRKSTQLSVSQETLVDFAAVRTQIFPVLKAKTWLDITRNLLKQIDPTGSTDVLYFPVNIEGVNLGYALAITDEVGVLNYVLSSYLEVWKVSENVLKKVALTNLEKKMKDEGENLWVKSKAGVYYLEGMGSVSASVILLPGLLSGLDVGGGDAVVVAPTGDLCMVAGSQSEARLCIIGEITVKQMNDPHLFNIKPLRLHDQQLAVYNPKPNASEHPVPVTLEELVALKPHIKPIKREKK